MRVGRRATVGARRAMAIAAVALASFHLFFGSACQVDVRLGEMPVDGGANAPDVAPTPDASAASDAPNAVDPIDGGFDVAAVNGLVLWLDGERGITPLADGGLAWLDQSGHANNAAAPIGAPTVTTTGFNGHHALAFDGTKLMTVPDGPTTRFTADYTVFVVAQSSTPPNSYAAFYGKQLQPNPYSGPAMFVNYAPQEGPRTSTVGVQVDFYHYIESLEQGLSDGVARIFAMQRAGNTLSITVGANPPSFITVPLTDVTAPGADTFIGGHIPAGVTNVRQPLTGAIAEVIVFNGTVSASDYAGVHGYLAGKYAVP